MREELFISEYLGDIHFSRNVQNLYKLSNHSNVASKVFRSFQKPQKDFKSLQKHSKAFKNNKKTFRNN